MAERISNPSERLLKVNRRELLASTTAAISAASIAPLAKPSEASAMTAPLDTAVASEAVAPHFSPAMALRLAQIEQRNELRREAKLPLLPMAKELRRMKEQDDRQNFLDSFEPFVVKHSKAVWDEVLKTRREALSDPNWKPKCWSEGVGYQSEVYRILRQRFGCRRALCWNSI